MARKGNQHKNGLDRKTTINKQATSESVDIPLADEKENICRSSINSGESINGTNNMGSGKRNKKKSSGVPYTEKTDIRSPRAQATETLRNVRDDIANDSSSVSSESRRNDGRFSASNRNLRHSVSRGFSTETMSDHIQSSLAAAEMSLRVLALDVLNAASGWLERQKPRLSTFTSYMIKARDYILVQMRHVYPIVWKWILHFGKLILLLSIVWMDCGVRGFTSLMRLGTASFFAIFWCSILSIIAMIGMTKAVIIMVIAGLVAVFIGMAIGLLVIAISSTVILWLYGSFWTTTLVVIFGGSSYALGHDRAALLITTLYSVHCARSYVGWLGLFLGLNLSFISSDILLYFLKNSLNEQRSGFPPEQNRHTQGQGEFAQSYATDNDAASRSAGVTSTSGCESEFTSEDEIVRLLNCGDHYSALGFARFENIDVTLLKREYRKKAMLVHPDKNMGNEKAADAFKKLQNAYEVLLDTIKRKTYDDELRREELLNYFRRFQTTSQKNEMNFTPGSTQFEAEDEGPFGESRRIICKKCGQFHMWILTERSKSKARWCQDCNDFHQAKDGDGWLEQSFQPFFFGLLNKVDAPRVYICAESRIYNATSWFICQGMRCPANTHKPSFHVNTGLSSSSSSKHGSNPRGPSSSNRSGAGMPQHNGEEPMTEEEFFEWLQNAMQSNESPSKSGSTFSGSASKSSAGGGSSAKKKRKGKKQW